jgi:predicted transcriptional regulator
METFVGSIRAEAVDTSKVEDIVNHFETYQAAAAKLDDKISQLEEEKQRLANEIKEEKMALRGPDTDQQLTQKATIGIYAETDGELELILTYSLLYPSCDSDYTTNRATV